MNAMSSEPLPAKLEKAEDLSALRQRAILIVDDDESIRHALARLVSTECAAVHRAASAAEALKILEAQAIDVLICDLMMPGVSGMELLRHVRHRWPRTRRIILSAYVEACGAVSVLAELADVVVNKPWNNTMLREVIRKEMSAALKPVAQWPAAPEGRDGSPAGLSRNSLPEPAGGAGTGGVAAAPVTGATWKLRALLRLLNEADPWNLRHSLRVARYAGRLGRLLGLERAQVKLLGLAGLAHDVGKVMIRKEVLEKREMLTASEFAEVREHVARGVAELTRAEAPEAVIRIVAEHHERLDGSGYPAKLGGPEISLGGRILAVADVLAAMTEPRPYHEVVSPLEAAAWLLDRTPAVFDAAVMKVLVNNLNRVVGK